MSNVLVINLLTTVGCLAMIGGFFLWAMHSEKKIAEATGTVLMQAQRADLDAAEARRHLALVLAAHGGDASWPESHAAVDAARAYLAGTEAGR